VVAHNTATERSTSPWCMVWNASSTSPMPMRGGIPLRDESGHVVGAIGVSESTVGNDPTVAEAGVKALD
jgi:uncharacterized protein GlcG (DUF336 family)